MSLEREAQLAEVPLLGEIVTAIEAELAWARRHGRALSLLALPISDVAPDGPEGRATDTIAVAPEHDRFVMLLPETTGPEARRLAERVCGGPPSAAAVASFPGDAATVEGLLLHLATEG